MTIICGFVRDALPNFFQSNLGAVEYHLIHHLPIYSNTIANRIITTVTMPAKRIPASRQPKGFFASTYSTLTDSENASIVRSVVIFGVRTSPLKHTCTDTRS